MASSSRPFTDETPELFVDSNNPGDTPVVPPIISEASSKKRERGRKSEVWGHFLLKQIDVGGTLQERAECKHCKSHYAFNVKGGTGTLSRHLKTCVPKQQTETPQQSQIHIGASSMSTFSYNQKKMREGLALYVAGAEQPFTFAEDPRLERWVKMYLQPSFSKISRNTARSDIFKLYLEKKSLLISELLCHTGAISLTSDLWTGLNNYGYICVTAHYIDPQTWLLVKKVIAFRMLDYPHTGNTIYHSIIEIIAEYNISPRIFSISFDNHTANTAAIDLFKRSFRPPYEGQLFHIRCCCHIINLIVRDGMKIIDQTPELNFIQKIRDLILFISSSPSRFQSFRLFCRGCNVRSRKFTTDVVTRWNSTYLMLKSTLGYEQILIDFSAQHGATNVGIIDFQYANLYLQFLEIFYVATNVLSGVYYPTSCIALNQIYNMAAAFSECRTYPIYHLVCEKMEQKFKKYWFTIPPLFYLASVMDPRKKLIGTTQLLEGISEALNIEISEDYQTILDKLTRLYTTYQTLYGSTTDSSEPSDPQPRFKDASWKLLSRGKRHVGSSSLGGGQKNELTTYLETEYISFLTYEELENFDILIWWKTHGRSLPVLSIMARDLLTPPMSTVASEACFSAGGRVLSEKRSRLKADILEALICLKDWDDAENRRQDTIDDIVEDFNNLDTTDGADE